MKKIGIVIPYFGKWPEWFQIFLETCRHNEKIEWIFFTDCSIPSNTPPNTIFKNMELRDFEKAASQKVGLNVEINRTYKICDFKPAFGEIFEKHLKKYDFWGWGDIDVLYGNLEKIFSESNLKKYDIISVRRHMTAGVLTILRNEKELKEMYKKSPDYERVFKDSVGYAFDETGEFKHRSVFSMTDIISKYRKKMKIKTLLWDYTETDKKIDDERKEMYWYKGEMFETLHGEEVYMYHFVDRKKNQNFTVPENIDMSKGFLVGREGIRDAKPSYSVERKPLRLAEKKMKDGLRWIRDRIEQSWG